MTRRAFWTNNGEGGAPELIGDAAVARAYQIGQFQGTRQEQDRAAIHVETLKPEHASVFAGERLRVALLSPDRLRPRLRLRLRLSDWHVRQASLGEEDEIENRNLSDEPCRVVIPAWERLATTQNRVLRGVRVTGAARRTQGVQLLRH